MAMYSQDGWFTPDEDRIPTDVLACEMAGITTAQQGRNLLRGATDDEVYALARYLHITHADSREDAIRWIIGGALRENH